MVMQMVKKASITFLARLMFFGQEWTKIEEDASAGEAVMAPMAAMAWHRLMMFVRGGQVWMELKTNADTSVGVVVASVNVAATADVAVVADVAVEAAAVEVATTAVAMQWYQTLFLGRHKPQLGGKRPTRYIRPNQRGHLR
uniref:Uncharacterized protein n=1 Tax=Phytophthora ramorum TaxID=164328 RepID=H3H049_PHYRM